MNHDDAYEHGSAKRSDYQPTICVFCTATGGRHYEDCVEVGS